jgi:predicted dehydrogenase
MKLGLIGCGYWGPNIVRNIQKIDGVDLEFIVDKDVEVFKKIPAATAFFDDAELALGRHSNVDGVIIATPISTHFKIAKHVLESGVSVLIQKPMAMSSEECSVLENIAKAKGLALMVAHTFLFTSSVRELKNLIINGSLGEIKHFDSVRINLGLFQRDSNVVWDLAPHDFSILSYLVGEKKPKTISAVGASHTPKGNADVANISVTYEDGFSAHIHISWFSPIKVRQIILNGDEKMAVYDDNKPSEKIMVYDKGVSYDENVFSYRSGDMFSPKLDNSEAIEEEIKHFCQCIQGGECISGPELGKRVVELIEATNKSIELKGQPIDV